MDRKIYEELKSVNIKNSNIHYIRENPRSLKFHLHDTYEMMLFLSGDAYYFIDGNKYRLSPRSLIVTNTNELHAPIFMSNETYERIVFHFSPYLAGYASSPDYSLKSCFIDRKNGFGNITLISHMHADKIKSYADEMIRINNTDNPLRMSLKLAVLTEILVLINELFSSASSNILSKTKDLMLEEIITHINNNISGDLSLNKLENLFHMNKNILCMKFKIYTGKTIHQYIIYKRIAKSKELLLNGMNVTEACLASGFIDYSNFIRTFKNITGITPGRYMKGN